MKLRNSSVGWPWCRNVKVRAGQLDRLWLWRTNQAVSSRRPLYFLGQGIKKRLLADLFHGEALFLASRAVSGHVSRQQIINYGYRDGEHGERRAGTAIHFRCKGANGALPCRAKLGHSAPEAEKGFSASRRRSIGWLLCSPVFRQSLCCALRWVHSG